MDERADGGDLSAEPGRQRRLDDDAAAERREVEWSATAWHSLVVGACGHEIELTTSTGTVVAGSVVDVGSRWCLVDTGGGSVAVSLDHIVSMQAPLRATPPRPIQRTLGSVLRRWARMRAELSLELVDARMRVGRVRQVLADAVTLEVAGDQDLVGGDRRGVAMTVPLDAVVTVRGPRLGLEE